MFRKVLIAGLALALVIQVVPYGHDRTNPTVRAEPAWDSQRTRTLFFEACGDCHSNETAWPWYSRVAPASWLVYRDVEEGREHLNVSEWGRPHNEGDEAAEMLLEDEMPPWFYLPAHPEARLSEAEKGWLVEGLRRTFPSETPRGG